MKKYFVALLASCISFGLASIPYSSVAADTPSQKSASSKPAPEKRSLTSKDDCENAPGAAGGYGHGMMFGYGGGMMGGYGDGMMMESPRMDIIRSMKLSDEQQSAIEKLSDELRHKNWAMMGSMMDETSKLRDLYEADKRDPAAIGAEYQKIFDLKRQMIESMLTTQNKVEDLLTPDQLKQLKEARKAMPMYGHPPFGHPSYERPSKGHPMY